MDVTVWLRSIGLERYEEIFRGNEIDWEILPELNETDLEKLGLPLGSRKKLLRAIAALAAAAPASGPAGEAASATEAPAAPHAERRQLTVLFCDLVGSTELSTRLDPEDLRELIRRYQDAVSGAVVRHGGYVASFPGDGVIAYFGWPRADEDEAAQAVRAGLDAVAAVGGLRCAGDSRLQARVGIASGIVVVGDLEAAGRRQAGVVAGETPNLAARLQALAEPETVVIGGLTRTLIGGAFRLDDLGPQALKGVAEPVPVWRVLGELPVESRFDIRAGRLMPLIGREQEIALLVGRFERAAAGEGQAVLLSGEAGIGKSRLVQGVHERLMPRPLLRLRLQCSPFHTASELYPLVRHLEYAAGLLRDDSPETKLQKLAALLGRAVEKAAESAALLAPLLGLPAPEGMGPAEPQQRQDRILRLLIDQLLGLARRDPLLFVLEDVHWIDPGTREFVTNLLARIAQSRILAVITCRPEFPSDWPNHPQVTLLTLGRLSRTQGAEVVRAAGGAALPEEVVARIERRADGVPLYIEELTRSVLEAGAAFDDSEIPETLQASLLARLDRLGSEAKELTQIAAVIGREFGIELLSAVTGQKREALAPALERLISAQIVLPIDSAQPGSYAFRHTLLQEAAYQSLLLTRRRRYHRDIARALETGFPEIADTRPEVVAQHYTAAAESAPAIAYWQLAGARAWARFAYREPVAYYEQALQLARTLPAGAARSRRMLDLLLLLGEAELRASRQQKGLETLKEAAALAHAEGSPADLARAALGVSEAEIMFDPPERQAAVVLEAALAALGDGEDALRCRVMSRLGQALFTTGNSDRAAVLLREATDLARRLGEPQALFDALICEWTATAGRPYSAGEFAECRKHCEDTLKAAAEIGDPHLIGRALARSMPSFLEMADLTGFEACFTRHWEIGERDQGFSGQRYPALSAAALRAILRGEFAAAAHLAGQAVDAAHGIHGEVAIGVYGVQMFTIRREQGRLAEVAPLLERFIADNPRDAAWRPGLALIASDLGFIEPARKAFAEIAATGFAFPIDAKRNLTLTYLAEVCARLGDAERAEQLYKMLLPYRDLALVVPAVTICCGANARYLGMLAARLGDWAAVEEHFEAALVMDERLQAWPWLAHTKHEYAVALLTRGRPRHRRRAETLLAEAAASAERIGMPVLQQKIRSQR